MKIISLQAENFKILKAVGIKPDGNMVVIGGKNGQGKSSCLDAVWVALAGKSVAPPKPVRAGEEECRIRLDLGEIIITRKFTDKDGKITDSVKVESDKGLRYPSPQKMLDDLLGSIGFDPFEFCQMKPEAQADQLLQLVPLPIDLEELATQDASDYARRRDVNRDAAQIKAQIDAILVVTLPDDIPDREALVAKLGNAADHNSAIERERMRRQEIERQAGSCNQLAENVRRRAEELRIELAKADAAAKEQDVEAERLRADLASAEPLAEFIDTQAVRQELHEAEQVLAIKDRLDRRAELVGNHAALVKQSEAFTEAMAGRERLREDALAKAKMPIDGLAFGISEKGKPVVTYRGVPFEQASTAEQLRASTAIAMAANPELRVLRIKDGSLLDEDSMALLAEMADAEDFQLFIEVVGTGGVGFVIENGMVKGAPEREPQPDKPKAKGGEKPEGALL